MRRRAPPRWVLYGALVCLLLAFGLQCVAFVRANSQTYDEALNLASGSLLWRGGPEINGEHPPFARKLAALPIERIAPPKLDVGAAIARREGGFDMGRRYLYEGGVPFERVLTLGRTPMVICAVALALLVGLFGWRLFGARAGLLALFLAAFDPNLIAHGSLVSTDGPLALFTTLAAFALAEHFARPRTSVVLLLGAAVGLCLATKFSGLVVAVSVCAALLVQAWTTGGVPSAWTSAPPPPRGMRALGHAVTNVAMVLGVSLLVVRIWYGGPHGLGGYVDGVRAQMSHQAGGHRAFFLGAVSSSGWTSYFPVALALKSPPLTLGLAALSLVLFRRGVALGRAAYAVVIPIVILLGASLLVRVDIGVRYVLPVVPLLIVLASRVATLRLPRKRVLVGLLALPLLHHAIAAVRVAPHDLAFFSDLAGGPARGHRYLSDSNLDWGQDLGTLAAWTQRERPQRLLLSYFGSASIDAHGIAYEPAPNACPHPEPFRPRPFPADGHGEFLAVSAMNAQGVFFREPDAYRWLETRTPVATLGWSIAIYDITHDAAAHRELANLYMLYGPQSYANTERARASAIDTER